MSDNPFSKMKAAPLEQRPPALVQPLQASNVFNSMVNAPAPAQSAALAPRVAVLDSDLDTIGKEVDRAFGQTTEKIIGSLGMSSFDDLGKLLVEVQSEVDTFDPSKVKKKGIAGLIQRTFGDIKKELTLRMSKADAVFEKLGVQINNHIAIHTTWVSDLEKLNDENKQRYHEFNKVIAQCDSMVESLKQSLAAWPPIDPNDPDAGMKAQERAVVEARLNRAQIKRDSFFRRKTICESNGPKIMSQQQTSRNTVMALGDILNETLPLIKWEFALFKQTLDAQKSINIVENAKNLANVTLIKSADGAKASALASAQALNNPVVETATLMHMKTRMLETLDGVRTIETTARAQRESDAKVIAESQKDYLTKLQSFNGS